MSESELQQDQQVPVETVAHKHGRKKDLVILAVVILAAIGVIAVFGFWQREITIWARYQPWQSGEAQVALDRFHHAAVKEDAARMEQVLHQQAAKVTKKPLSIEYPSGNGKGSSSFAELAKAGPFKAKQLELSYYGKGGLVVHAQDKSETPWRFLTEKDAQGQLRIVGLSR